MYEKQEKKEIQNASTILELQKLQKKYADAQAQIPEGEGRNIFSRLFDEVSSKIASYKKDVQKIRRHTENHHIVMKTSTEQKKLKDEIVHLWVILTEGENYGHEHMDRWVIQVPNSPTKTIQQMWEPKEAAKTPEKKNGFFLGATDGMMNVIEFLKK